MATKMVRSVALEIMAKASEKWGVDVRPEGRNLARRLRDDDTNYIALTTWLTMRMASAGGTAADFLARLERELRARARYSPARSTGGRPARRGRRRYPRRR